MGQHIIKCPKCNTQHEVDVFRNSGIAVAIFSIKCGEIANNTTDCNKLLGLMEKHRQAMINMEMPIDEGFGRINPHTYGEIIN